MEDTGKVIHVLLDFLQAEEREEGQRQHESFPDMMKNNNLQF